MVWEESNHREWFQEVLRTPDLVGRGVGLRTGPKQINSLFQGFMFERVVEGCEEGFVEGRRLVIEVDLPREPGIPAKDLHLLNLAYDRSNVLNRLS